MAETANAGVKVTVGVTGAEQLTGLSRGFKAAGDSAERMEMRLRQAAQKAAAQQERLTARATAAAMRQAASNENASARTARAMDRQAQAAERGHARSAAAAERAAAREKASAITVENEMAKLQRQRERSAARTEARGRLGLDSTPGFFTGHGFQSRARAALGAMRDLAGAGWAAYGAYRLVSGAVESVIDPAMKFQTLSAQARIKGGFTAQQQSELEQSALRQSRGTGFSANDIMAANVELAAAGLSQSQIKQYGGSAQRFGAANSLDAGRASAILVETGSQFGMGAEGFERIGDVITKAANISTISVEDMSESLKYVGPVAKAAGWDIEFTAATIALLGEAGIKGSMGGTALRTAITSLVHPAKQAKAAMAELGISKADLQKGINGGSAGFQQFLSTLDTKMTAKNMSSAQRLEMEKLLFGAEGFNAIETLMNRLKDTGDNGWGNYTNKVRQASGAMKDAADIMSNTLEGRTKKFNASLDALKISMSNTFMPGLSNMLDKLTSVTDVVADEGIGGAFLTGGDSVAADIKAGRNQTYGPGDIVEQFGAGVYDLFHGMGSHTGNAPVRASYRGLNPNYTDASPLNGDQWVDQVTSGQGLLRPSFNAVTGEVENQQGAPAKKQEKSLGTATVEVRVRADNGTSALIGDTTQNGSLRVSSKVSQ